MAASRTSLTTWRRFRFTPTSGNVKFRGFIADCRKTYEKTKRGKKYHLVQEIVDTVKQSSGLFLKADDEGWIVVDDAAAGFKVGALFRTLRTQDGRKCNLLAGSNQF